MQFPCVWQTEMGAPVVSLSKLIIQVSLGLKFQLIQWCTAHAPFLPSHLPAVITHEQSDSWSPTSLPQNPAVCRHTLPNNSGQDGASSRVMRDQKFLCCHHQETARGRSWLSTFITIGLTSDLKAGISHPFDAL